MESDEFNYCNSVILQRNSHLHDDHVYDEINSKISIPS